MNIVELKEKVVAVREAVRDLGTYALGNGQLGSDIVAMSNNLTARLNLMMREIIKDYPHVFDGQ